MPMRDELAISRTRSDSATAADREFWIIVAFCAIGFAATMYIFEHLPFLLNNLIVLG
jgi:hypothetical protein